MTTPTDDVGPRFRIGLTVLLIAIATWGVVDLALDRPQDWLSVHVLVEIGFVLLSIGSVLYLWLGWMQARRSLVRTEGRLAANEVERDHWRARTTRLLHGLGAEIDARESCTLPLGKDAEGREVNVRIGRHGPFLEREGDPVDRVSVPDGIAPDALDIEMATATADR